MYSACIHPREGDQQRSREGDKQYERACMCRMQCRIGCTRSLWRSLLPWVQGLLSVRQTKTQHTHTLSFRRSVFEDRRYRCRSLGNCDITNGVRIRHTILMFPCSLLSESRNRCRACRLKKCVLGGMSAKCRFLACISKCL